MRSLPRALLVLLAGAGCQNHTAPPDGAQAAALSALPSELPLTEAESWALAPLETDPFASYAAGRVPCSGLALRREAGWLEVSTTDCNYATLSHLLDADLPAGSTMYGQLSWAILAALSPAVGTLAIATSDEVLWTLDVAIPGGAGIVDVELDLKEALPAGSALYFHVRNHGYNTWQLGPLTLDAAGP